MSAKPSGTAGAGAGAAAAAPPPPGPKPVELDAKSKSLLSKARKYHDSKRFKLALKTVDTVLRKYPKSGEAMALRGYVLLVSADTDAKKVEALDSWIKRGVKADPSCVDSWRHFAHGCRLVRRWKEAMEAWANVAKLEKRPDEKAFALRELASYQAHLRMLPEHLETRMQLFRDATPQKYDWHYAGVVAANHLLGKHKAAIRALDDLRARLEGRTETPGSSLFETKMDMLVYKAQLEAEAGEAAAGLATLEAKYPDATKAPALVQERMAELMLKTDKFDAAATFFTRLIRAGASENCDMHRGLQVRFSLALSLRARCSLVPHPYQGARRTSATVVWRSMPVAPSGEED